MALEPKKRGNIRLLMDKQCNYYPLIKNAKYSEFKGEIWKS